MAATTPRAKSTSSRSSGRTRSTPRASASKSSGSNGTSQTSRGRSGASASGATSANGSSHSHGIASTLTDNLPSMPSMPDMPSMPSMPHIGDTAKTVGAVVLPITTAAAGLAGGIVLARTKLRNQRKVLGVPLPGGSKVDFSDLTKQVGEAGRQFGNLASEVKAAREKAEQISRAIGN